MWVGKFETGYKGATTTSEAQKNENNPNKIQIKPNVYSWRGIQVANTHLSSYNYKREMDSHMMKNTEWGAVAYLQHSKYGSREKVRINNNSSYITGYAAKNKPNCGYTGANEDCNKYESVSPFRDGIYTVNYKNSASQVASTTGNYSGIYDMSGGAWEYVMGVMLYMNGWPCSGRNSSLNSGFNGSYCYTGGSKIDGVNFPNSKYYDVYSYLPSDYVYNRRILGDATGEMGSFSNINSRYISSWYEEDAWFVFTGNPWFIRGGGTGVAGGVNSGVFAFGNEPGGTWAIGSFRIVLSPV